MPELLDPILSDHVPTYSLDNSDTPVPMKKSPKYKVEWSLLGGGYRNCRIL